MKKCEKKIGEISTKYYTLPIVGDEKARWEINNNRENYMTQ